MKKEIVEQINDAILETLKDGQTPVWELPWTGGANFNHPENSISTNGYKGVNYWNLILSNKKNKFLSNQWVTFKQAQELGGMVRKGSKSEQIVFYKMLESKTKTVKTRKGTEEAAKIPLLQYSNVFNLSQIEGLEHLVLEGQTLTNHETRQDIDFSKLGANIVYEPSARACFKGGATDLVQLPVLELFKSVNGYYATAFHEFVHWTGHPSRLNREMSGEFGSAAYAFEELVAEFGASYLCAHYGFEYSTQHAAYIQSWIKALGANPDIMKATSKAQKAAAYLIERLDDQELLAASENLTANEINQILNTNTQGAA